MACLPYIVLMKTFQAIPRIGPGELVTHDGKFHADEVLSTAVLQDLFPGTPLIRTRDADLTRPQAGRLVYDVGGIFDPDLWMFDHHQNDAPRREGGASFSSFGMIWQSFGREWLIRCANVPSSDVEPVWLKIDRTMVSLIDACDTGETPVSDAGVFRNMTLPILIEDMNPVFDNRDPAAERAAFDAAVFMSRGVLLSKSAIVSASLRADVIVRSAIISSGASPILELPMGMPYERSIKAMKADHILFVVVPRANEWTISTVRDSPGSFDNRRDLPAEWAGLTDGDLEVATGVAGASFCHKGLFFATAATRDAILEMAKIAISRVPENFLPEVSDA